MILIKDSRTVLEYNYDTKAFDTATKLGVLQCSICVGSKKNGSVVTNVVSSVKSNINNGEKTLYLNGLLENAIVNFYNSYKYSNTYLQEVSGNTNGANGLLRYTGTTTSPLTLTSINHKRRIINKYDSFFRTLHATTDTLFYNPTLDSSDNTCYAGLVFGSDEEYVPSSFAFIHGVNPHPGEWPSPILFNTTGATNLLILDGTDIVKSLSVTSKITFIYNLIPNKTYMYRLLNGDNELNTGTFKTFGLIRQIKFEAVRNARDLGGYKTVDGNEVFRYGKIFRGSLFDRNNVGSSKPWTGFTPEMALTNNDKSEFTSFLKVTKEIDLRKTDTSTTYPQAHIPNVSVVRVNGTDTATSYDGLASNFSLFITFVLTVINGVVYVHCKEGRDRTGTFCETLLALCGIHADGIQKDYELTTLWGNPTWRTEILTWNHSDCTSVESTWDKTNTFGAMKTAVSSTASTILQIVEDWFKGNYTENALKKADGTSLVNALDALTYIRSILLEDADSEPIPVTPTPVDLFVSYNYRPSESASNLVYTTPSTWKFYEILVNQGDTITITLDSPTNVVAVESTNGLSSRLANGTSNITSGWTNWDFHYHGVSSDYTVLNDGYLLLIVSTSRTATITHNSSSQPDVTPTVTCNFINSNSIPHSMTGDALTYIAPNEAVELGGNSESPNVAHKWTYGEISVTSGDVVRVGLNTIDVFNWEVFVESTNGLLSSIANNTKVTFNSTQAHKVTSKDNGKVWDTISTGHYLYYGEHTVSSTGKLLIGVRIWNDGDPNTITPATYNGIIVKINNNSIPVTWYS